MEMNTIFMNLDHHVLLLQKRSNLSNLSLDNI